METVLRKVDVKERLPQNPFNRNPGGQKVSIPDPNGKYYIVKDCNENIFIAAFHFKFSKWFTDSWNCRSMFVDEEKHRDITQYITHWYEEIELSSIGGEEKTLDKDEVLAAIRDKAIYHYQGMTTQFGENVPVKFASDCCGNSFEEGIQFALSKLAVPSKKGEPNTEEILSKVKGLSVYKKIVNDWKGTKFKPLVVDYIRLDEVLEILEPKK